MYKRTVKTAKQIYFDKKIQEIALLKNNSKRYTGTSSNLYIKINVLVST